MKGLVYEKYLNVFLNQFVPTFEWIANYFSLPMNTLISVSIEKSYLFFQFVCKLINIIQSFIIRWCALWCALDSALYVWLYFLSKWKALKVKLMLYEFIWFVMFVIDVNSFGWQLLHFMKVFSHFLYSLQSIISI